MRLITRLFFPQGCKIHYKFYVPAQQCKWKMMRPDFIYFCFPNFVTIATFHMATCYQNLVL